MFKYMKDEKCTILMMLIASARATNLEIYGHRIACSDLKLDIYPIGAKVGYFKFCRTKCFSQKCTVKGYFCVRILDIFIRKLYL